MTKSLTVSKNLLQKVLFWVGLSMLVLILVPAPSEKPQASIPSQNTKEAVLSIEQPTPTATKVQDTPAITVVPSPTEVPSPTPPPPGEPAQVTRVIDGDTIEVIINNQKYKVRYIGIDTPEYNENRCLAQKATDYNASLVANRTVYLERDVEDKDRYGRLLRYVYVQQGDTFIFVNKALVEAGWAKLLTIPPNVRYVEVFKEALEQAKAQKRGMWGDNVCVLARPTAAPTTTTVKTITTPKPTPQDACAAVNCSANVYNCKDFDSWNQAQFVYTCCLKRTGRDIHRLDGDNDGIACESLR